jgi:hypothetical protein
MVCDAMVGDEVRTRLQNYFFSFQYYNPIQFNLCNKTLCLYKITIILLPPPPSPHVTISVFQPHFRLQNDVSCDAISLFPAQLISDKIKEASVEYFDLETCGMIAECCCKFSIDHAVWRWMRFIFVALIHPCLHRLIRSAIYKPIPWSRILLEKVIVAQMVNKFREFYGPRRFINIFTKLSTWSFQRLCCHVMKICRGRRGNAPRILNLGSRQSFTLSKTFVLQEMLGEYLNFFQWVLMQFFLLAESSDTCTVIFLNRQSTAEFPVLPLVELFQRKPVSYTSENKSN